MNEPPISVAFPSGGSWRPNLSAAAVSVLLQRMATQDVAAIGRVVFKALGLPDRPELAERLAHESQADGDKGLKLKHYRWINRALSMELLVSLLLTHLNRAKRVRSFCVADEGRAYYFAGPGRPDLLADYPAESGDASAFRVLGEVSAKREITPKWHLDQLERALRHAQSELAKDAPSPPIIAWVVNNGDVGSDPDLRRQYQKFVRKHGLDKEGSSIKVVPMHTADAAFALASLCSEPPAEGLRFPSGRLADALSDMAGGLMAESPPGGEGWMADLFVESVGGQAPLLPPAYEGDDPTDDEDGPPGTR